MSRNAPDSWKQLYFKRIKQLVDNYQPDLLYTDGGIPFEEYGLGLVANLYNVSAKRHGGQVEAIYTSKTPQDCQRGRACSTWNAASRREFRPTRGRRTPASATGTITRGPSTRRPSGSSTC